MTAEPNVDLWQHGGPPEPARLMHVIAEIWPLAADERGIWLLSGRWPWQTLPFADDTSYNAEFQWELQQHGAVAVLGPHGCSDRIDGPANVVCSFAVIDCRGPIRASWPQAEPVSPRLMKVYGKPPTHPANKVPDEIHHSHVLVGALRHLAFQLTPYGDAELADKLDKWWRLHLADWAPILFRLYDRVHESTG